MGKGDPAQGRGPETPTRWARRGHPGAGGSGQVTANSPPPRTWPGRCHSRWGPITVTALSQVVGDDSAHRVLASAGHGSLLGHPETLCTVRGDGSVSQLPQARSTGLTSHEARGAEPAEEAGVPETPQGGLPRRQAAEDVCGPGADCRTVFPLKRSRVFAGEKNYRRRVWPRGRRRSRPALPGHAGAYARPGHTPATQPGALRDPLPADIAPASAPQDTPDHRSAPNSPHYSWLVPAQYRPRAPTAPGTAPGARG